MAQFSLRDFKKQASFFLREKINDARLALTDVSRIQIMAEEATNEDPWGPETKAMATLAEAAFQLEEYDRIVQVIRNRLDMSKQRPWRQLYKTLMVLEYLLTHGPASMRKEFAGDILRMEELAQFNFTDQQGIDRGAMVRKVADRVMQVLIDPELWKEERSRAQKVSFGIRGFGSSMKVVSSQDVGQGEDGSVDGSSNKLSGETGASIEDQGATVMPFKKSISSLSYLRERLPHSGRQNVTAREYNAEDLEVTSLLEGEEKVQPPSQQVFHGEGKELAQQIVIC
ncbi:hypothetical protein KP509_14G076200 [Ceratopteris richardii]|uniref:ENTH domain-containing protein n=3 Tax=Ceratopteris richardii TaxID=49495 RepID=A0A8T2TDB7_CERRI|nr:hypothetical protein KP509_14G076200 [Ceratopteris richardii]